MERPRLFLAEKLLKKSLENVIGHDAGIGVGLAFAMKNGGGRLVDAVGLAEGGILVDHGIEGATLDQRTNLSHFRGGEDRSNCAVHVATLLPLFLVLKKGLFHELHFAQLRRGSRVTRGYSGVGMHGERKIAVNHRNLATSHVVVPEAAIPEWEK